MRNALIFHIVSGQAFFSGAALIVAGALLPERSPRRSVEFGRAVLIWLGLLLVIASATPLSIAYYAAAIGVTLAWLVAQRSTRASSTRAGWLWRGAVIGVWCLGGLLEAPYHRIPVLPPLGAPSVEIVGDSLAAGMGTERVTWPRLLAQCHAMRDLSLAGATAATAVRDQAPRVARPGALVLVEIGGNDVLAGTPPREFARALNTLLDRVCADGRTVVMLELPLPPLYHRYGLIQRSAARTHGVRLVPKRVMLAVLLAPGATLDTIHLSPRGHELMARALGPILEPAYRASDAPRSGRVE